MSLTPQPLGFPIILLLVLILMSTTTSIYAVILYSVAEIITTGSPPKIFDPIVLGVSIDMVHLTQTFRVGDIAFSYETVYAVFLTVNRDKQVTETIGATESPMGGVIPALWKEYAAVLTDPNAYRVSFNSHARTRYHQANRSSSQDRCHHLPGRCPMDGCWRCWCLWPSLR